MNILHPHGMVERLGERYRKPVLLARYGRKKEGSPNDARSLKIADELDRRRHPRQEGDPLRGRLLNVNA